MKTSKPSPSTTNMRLRLAGDSDSWAPLRGAGEHLIRLAKTLASTCSRLALPVLLLAATATVGAQVTYDRLLRADREPQNWLTYSGSYMSQRHSPLTQITPANVKNLELQWVWQARSLERFQATALVVDGILYTVQAPNDIVALDAVTGKLFWMYSYRPAATARPCCGRVNRGVAILGDTLFMGTIDAHLIAVDAKGGKPIWDVAIAKPESGYAITHAPLVKIGRA